MDEDNRTQRVRSVACKVPLVAINKGKYIKENEGLSPNYIEIGELKFSRVNVIGVVVSLDANNGTAQAMTLDDGTDKLSVRGFEQTIPSSITMGNVVTVIGKPREFGTEKYIVPEIIKKTTQTWFLVRKKELQKVNFGFPSEDIPVQEDETLTDISEEDIIGPLNDKNILSKQEKVVNFIRKHDSGKGVDIEEIISNTEVENCEKVIEDMLKEGDLFETMPGKIKILE
jgi:hypothetical protein